MLFGMSTADKIRSAAVDVVLTWGPERVRPEIDQLRDSLPDVDDAEGGEALKAAWKVLSEAEAQAGNVKSGRMSESQLCAMLRKDRSWLTSDQAGRTVSQAMYYHWRETGE